MRDRAPRENGEDNGPNEKCKPAHMASDAGSFYHVP